MSSIMSRIRLGFVGLSVVALMASGVAASPAMAHKRNHKATGKSVRQSANGGSASANGGNGGNGGLTICVNNSKCTDNGNGGDGGKGGTAEGGDGGGNAAVGTP